LRGNATPGTQSSKNQQAKRKLALKLFRLNLELMEITKNWPADAVNT
jgi:hypothetical protein